jgi:hypothetical protein
MRKTAIGLGLNEPLRLNEHPRPRTRREFLAQGFLTGAATVMVPSVLAGLFTPRFARAALSQDVSDFAHNICNITAGAGKIPFIAFDLVGGGNVVGSNVLIGGQGGQLDFLTTAGYSKLGLPGNMIPNPSATGNFIDSTFGLRFHSDSAYLRGMLTRTGALAKSNTGGSVIAALSQNDTGNNPHNPMYGIYKAGAKGQLLGLIGSQSSISGGNSMAPAVMIDVTAQPTKVSQASDVTGLVDTGELGTLLPAQDVTEVMESMKRISDGKMSKVTAYADPTQDAASKKLAQCSYTKAAYLTDQFSDPSTLNPDIDPLIVGPTGIFTQAEYSGDVEFQKTAAIMKMVIGGFAGAGTITMGGFDYHTGDRMTGEARDFRAGVCIGACLEYAARKNSPLMIYLFSDGSLASNGMVDNSVGGRGKGVWTGDNQNTAATFFLVFNPTKAPTHLPDINQPNDGRIQIGWFNGDGSVNTGSSPAANAVNLLSATAVLNYMALHGEQANFANLFGPNWSGLGSSALQDSVTAFAPIVNGTVANPV